MRVNSIRGLGRAFLFGLFTLTASCGGDTTGGGTGTATPSGAGTATGTYVLSWDAVPDAAVTGYRAYFSTTSVFAGKIAGKLETSGTEIRIVPADYGFSEGSTLYMAVIAIANDGRESPVSDEVSILLK